MLAMRHKKAVSAETKKRYAKATKKEKTIILDQFTAITGYNRCCASQILSVKKENNFSWRPVSWLSIFF